MLVQPKRQEPTGRAGKSHPGAKVRGRTPDRPSEALRRVPGRVGIALHCPRFNLYVVCQLGYLSSSSTQHDASRIVASFRECSRRGPPKKSRATDVGRREDLRTFQNLCISETGSENDTRIRSMNTEYAHIRSYSHPSQCTYDVCYSPVILILNLVDPRFIPFSIKATTQPSYNSQSSPRYHSYSAHSVRTRTQSSFQTIPHPYSNPYRPVIPSPETDSTSPP